MSTTGVGNGVPRRLFVPQLGSSDAAREGVSDEPQVRSSRLTPHSTSFSPVGRDQSGDKHTDAIHSLPTTHTQKEPPLPRQCSVLARILQCGVAALACAGCVYSLDKAMQNATISARQSTGTVAMSCSDATWETRRARARGDHRREFDDLNDEMAKGGCSDLRPLWTGPLPCRLAIINAGMPRTGSTLTVLLIQEALRLLKFSQADTKRFL